MRTSLTQPGIRVARETRQGENSYAGAHAALGSPSESCPPYGHLVENTAPAFLNHGFQMIRSFFRAGGKFLTQMPVRGLLSGFE